MAVDLFADCGNKFADNSSNFGLTGCLATYGSISLKGPEEGHSLAPWVAITYEGSGSVITVSNQSSPNTPPPHVACIKSFEMGFSQGLTVRCVIHDTQGGNFFQFMRNIFNNFVCSKEVHPASIYMKVRFGWVKSGCGTNYPIAQSRCFYCVANAVETNYAEGKFMFDITGKDLIVSMQQGAIDDCKGGLGKDGVFLTDAIEEILKKSCPPNIQLVKFMRMEGGKPVPCPFKDGEGDKLKGPKGKWDANSRNKIDAAKFWLNDHKTNKNFGWIPQYNSLVEGGEIIFWEDPKPKEVQPDSVWDERCVGTYIVNGGKNSPVIEFNPKINWNFALLASSGGQQPAGVMDGKNGAQGNKQPGQDIPNLDAKGQPCAGQPIQAPAGENRKDLDGKNAQKEQIGAQNAAIRANASYITTSAIQADLVVVGDPTIAYPDEVLLSKSVTIIVVNPYYISDVNTQQACGSEWMAQPVCNNVLSNKGWLLKSVTHRIEAGKYTTILGVKLTTPGIDTPPGSPVGAWAKGWMPIPCK